MYMSPRSIKFDVLLIFFILILTLIYNELKSLSCPVSYSLNHFNKVTSQSKKAHRFYTLNPGFLRAVGIWPNLGSSQFTVLVCISFLQIDTRKNSNVANCVHSTTLFQAVFHSNPSFFCQELAAPSHVPAATCRSILPSFPQNLYTSHFFV